MQDPITHPSQPPPRLVRDDISIPDRHRAENGSRRGLITAAAAVALTAYGGAIALILGIISLGGELDERLPFASPVFGGVALAVVVAVPFTLVAVAAWRGSDRTDRLSRAAGFLLIGWIVVEFLFIRELSFLHPCYLAIGIGFVAASAERPTRWSARPRHRRQRADDVADSVKPTTRSDLDVTRSGWAS